MENNSVINLFPMHLRKRFEVCGKYFEELQEIRIRSGQPVIVILNGKEYFLKADGSLGEEMQNAYRLSSTEVTEILNHTCNYSVYAFEDEIKQGFITVAGGHRVGVAGQAVLESDGRLRYLKHINYMNIRVSHQKPGVADVVLSRLYENGCFINTLIISPPGCGKTTMLRDLIRRISDGNEWGDGCAVSVIDERSEIAGSYQGIPQNDVGMRTDVLDACPKLLGMMMAIRSMAPKVLAIDELGDKQEMRMLERAGASGCRILATIHAESVEDVFSKDYMQMARQSQFFKRYILMGRREGIPAVFGIYDERLKLC